MSLGNNDNYLILEFTKLKDEMQYLESNLNRLRERYAESAQENASLKAKVERLTIAGDAMSKNYFETYWTLYVDAISRYEPASITDWEEAKKS